MRKSNAKRVIATALTMCMAFGASACGKSGAQVGGGEFQQVDASELTFPLAEKTTLTGTISYPANTESDPNNRTIFKRLQEQTNVEIQWTAIQSDQWGDKISLEMSNVKTLTDFVFSAGFSDSDLLKYAKQGAIISLEDYIDAYMPNLKAVFDKYPEYRTMCEDENGHIWALPWIEQLGSEKTAIQTVGDMSFINKKWLDFLGLEMPTTVDEFEQVLIAFRDNADAIQKEFNIDGSIIPMSCIVNDGDQDPAILINGFGEGYGDADRGRHIAVTDDLKVICSSTQMGYKDGIAWLHKLYDEGLIDSEAFTQEWSTYVSKGKSGRYGVCFSWDVANIDNLEDWVPLPALTADTRNITPQNGSFTSGFDRGRCVVTSVAKNPALVCAWLDLMYDPFQSPQNNWGTYGEDDEFDIFELGTNDKGEKMLKHAPLGDASPVEVREAECVGGPLAILDEYYGVYVTCPDDAQYRLDWIKDIYTPDMNTKYVYPNVFMSEADTKRLSDLSADVTKCINSHKADWIMNGFTDADWDAYIEELNSYGLEEYLSIYQKYLDAFYAE
ncbi:MULTISPECIES: extracellular solute-binding protein [Butyrivibrio]|jgi:putative aldouronate transport system substrate-binding protein|uniref:ABC transporter substrate-binding protein n=1 Tax=Butyrivibrio fibrisolvens TaxID=831 RepID=A0A317G8P9_BUTFI|nr:MULTISPECIES: extracellular solute-binding protein [Butyrivibrio]PWT29233.1 ABC transporter substrate-binding protein [Butyrivibrio fibrisolvens]SEQ14394.1 putative aldouronate transport system substrate-binding protein [Butyrivibrio sp. TB]